jgi:tRNA threonylcarbamoyladenosine biosynthesis protein TsaE
MAKRKNLHFETIENRRAMARFTARVVRLVRASRARRGAFVIGLVGNLGAGKTAFVQEFAKLFHVKQRVASPTFLVARRYSIPRSSSRFTVLYHIDLYRIRRASELRHVGFREAVHDPQAIVLVEWADRFPRSLPKSAAWIYLEHGELAGERKVAVRAMKVV